MVGPLEKATPQFDKSAVIVITAHNRISTDNQVLCSAGRQSGRSLVPKKGEPVTNRRSHSVLCIGNDPVRLNLRCALLKEHGWSVVSAANGHEGIIRFVQEPVDVVVLDFNDDGSESALIASELKRLRPRIPIVILVAEGKPLVHGATQQADAVVVKSEENLRLVDALRRLLPAS